MAKKIHPKGVVVIDPEAVGFINKKATRERRTAANAATATILEALGEGKTDCPAGDVGGNSLLAGRSFEGKRKHAKAVEITAPEAVELIKKRAANDHRSAANAATVTILEALGGYNFHCPSDDENQVD